MFDTLQERLSGVFDRLSGRGVLSDKDVDEALREVRVALLEADVALPVARDFVAKAKERASGEAVIRSVRPADQVVVLPEPCRPAIRITDGGLTASWSGTGSSPPRVSTKPS